MLAVVGPTSAAGTYQQISYNHGKRVYKRDGPANGYIYFWDARDGLHLEGWWLGPEVGGNDVWAHHPGDSDDPPASGYCVKDAVCDAIQLSYHPLSNTPGSTLLCYFMNADAQGCLNPWAAGDPPCIRRMCRMHCKMFGEDCVRHNGAWQKTQDAKSRTGIEGRARRRRGGKKARGSRGPYEAA